MTKTKELSQNFKCHSNRSEESHILSRQTPSAGSGQALRFAQGDSFEIISKKNANRTVIATNRISKKACAFTFVEVLVALTVVSISLLALLRLHLISVNMAEKARITTEAMLLAQSKIAESLANGYPESGMDSGVVENGSYSLHWQTDVRDTHLPRLNNRTTTGLREILVSVSWKQGVGRQSLQMSTYVADRQLQ